MEHSTSDQPTGPTDEPAMLNLDALGGVKAVREAMCVAQVDIGRSGRSMAEAGRGMTLIAKIIDACDVHRPLGPDGKHGTGRCTPTCGCVDRCIFDLRHLHPPKIVSYERSQGVYYRP